MLYKNMDEFIEKRREIIERLQKERISIRQKKREPLNKVYSGIISNEGKILKLNFPNGFVK